MVAEAVCIVTGGWSVGVAVGDDALLGFVIGDSPPKVEREAEVAQGERQARAALCGTEDRDTQPACHPMVFHGGHQLAASAPCTASMPTS